MCIFYMHYINFLQCFDSVGWASGRAFCCRIPNGFLGNLPSVGCAVERIDPLHFLADVIKAIKPGSVCVLSSSWVSLSNMFCVVLFTRAAVIALCFFLFCLLADLVRLSVPVQVLDWKTRLRNNV